MKKLPFCVYVLKSQKDSLLYIGFTTDLHRRLTEHIALHLRLILAFEGRASTRAAA